MSSKPLIVPIITAMAVFGVVQTARADAQALWHGFEDVSASLRWVAASIAFAGVAVSAALLLRPRNK